MKQVTINLYKFDELSDEAKEKAIQGLYDINIDHDWWEWAYEDAKNIGLKITSFNDHSCEGDFILEASEVVANIFVDHGVGCETYKTANEFMNKWEPVFANYMDETHADYESSESETKLLDLESEFSQSLLEDYRILLIKDYEYRTSDEIIIETIKCNDYDFTEDGELY